MKTGADDATMLNNAIALHQTGRLEEAAVLYQRIMEIKPEHPDAWHLLGVIASQSGDYSRAINLIGKAIAISPDVAMFHYNLGLAFHSEQKLDEAETAYLKALSLQPDHLDALNNLGAMLREKNRFAEAEKLFRKILALQPGNHEAHNNLGVVLERMEEAEAAFRRALSLKPDYFEAQNNLGNNLQYQGRLEEAEKIFRSLLSRNPGNSNIHLNLGKVLQDQGRLDEAMDAYREALILNPGNHLAYINQGVLLQLQGKIDEAIAAYRMALELKPDDAAAHANYSLVLLLKGDFREGWKNYEWRWEGNRQLKKFRRNFLQPQWQGGELSGRRILLHAEQGLGDSLQFIRYAPLVAERGGHVIVECQPELKRLFNSVDGIKEIVSRDGAAPTDFDVHCSLLSLPLAFNTDVETIPANIPYLKADEQSVAHWRNKIGEDERLKIGLVWAGNPRKHDSEESLIDRRRSCRLEMFAPLAAIPGARYFSLQKGETGRQAANPPAGLDLCDLTSELHDFADTAALIANLDLVISVDTSVAHLAGGMGKPVWLLSRLDGCWRWLLDREDSPWYPNMRLFRQRQAGNWEDVIEGVCGALGEMLSQRSRFANSAKVFLRHSDNSPDGSINATELPGGDRR